MLPAQMKVVEIAAPGGPEQLKPATRPLPQPGEGEVLVRVEAAGVNRPDVMQRQGRYPPPPGASDLPGMEIAGEIVALGPKVSDLAPGDRITSLLPGGGYAEYAIAAAPLCMPVPTGLSMVEAAALPETFLTVWTNLFERSGCKSGDVVLIHAAPAASAPPRSSSRTCGAPVLPPRDRRRRRAPAAPGARHRLRQRIQVIRANRRLWRHITLDMVAGSCVQRNLKSAVEGRVIAISLLGGSRAEINMGMVLTKRLTLTGSTLRSRTVAQKAAVADAVRHNVWPLLAAGRVRPIIYATFPLAEASEAHRLMESSNHIGKIVLTI